MYVIKKSGDKEKFKPKKVLDTCLRAGASRKFAQEVVKEVSEQVYDGISTKELLKLTINALKKEPVIAAKYDLKQAIFRLGPTGFPFENYFARVLENHGYKTTVGRLVKGKRVKHEVDITAVKDSVFMIECKHHGSVKLSTDLQVALYTYARFLDLRKHYDVSWLVCNTKLTSDALEYSKGVNQRVTCWGYPKSESLQALIEPKKLYPITLLDGVNKYIKNKLFNSNILLLKDLLTHELTELEKTGIPAQTLNKLVNQAKSIMGYKE